MNKLIGGVDFSGAKEPNNETWLAIGRLTDAGLEIIDVHRTGVELKSALDKAGTLAALGMDFPFSLPADFVQFTAKRLEGKSMQSWQEVVEHLAFMTFDDFIGHAKAFKTESKRLADTYYKALAISPLHRGNPSMVQMTFQGMRFLARLDPQLYSVLPFSDPHENACSVLEVFPRATLWSLHLPDSGYKSADPKEQSRVQSVRAGIVSDLLELREKHPLSCKNFPNLNLKKFRDTVISSDHALDAVLACYTTATWMVAPEVFPDPFDAGDENVLLEGWIYAPSKVRQK